MSLPGHLTRGSYPEPCEGEGCDCQESTMRIQGETDSFGCEYLYFCDKHGEEMLADLRKPHVAECDWCHREAELKHTRDPEEGTHGTVYELCPNCRDMVYHTASGGA